MYSTLLPKTLSLPSVNFVQDIFVMEDGFDCETEVKVDGVKLVLLSVTDLNDWVLSFQNSNSLGSVKT